MNFIFDFIKFKARIKFKKFELHDCGVQPAVLTGPALRGSKFARHCFSK